MWAYVCTHPYVHGKRYIVEGQNLVDFKKKANLEFSKNPKAYCNYYQTWIIDNIFNLCMTFGGDQIKKTKLVKTTTVTLVKVPIQFFWNYQTWILETDSHGNTFVLRKLLHSSSYLCPKEAIALLFHVVVDDTGHLLLPDLQPVDVHIVLDILKRASEPLHLSTKTLQPRS